MISISQIANTDVFGKLFATVNLMANAFSTSVLSIDSNNNVVTNSTIFATNLTSNTANISFLTSNTTSVKNLTIANSINLGNSTSFFSANQTSFGLIGPNTSIIISTPTASQSLSGSYFLNANGSFTTVAAAAYPISNTSLTTTNNVITTIDNWSMTNYNCAQYIVNVYDNLANNYYSSTILTMHDGTNSYITEYAQITSNTSVGVFSTTSNSNNLYLNFTPVSKSTVVKFFRVLM